MPNAPAASCAIVVIERTRVTTSTPESPDVPARNGFTTYFALSPGDRAFLSPSSSGYGLSAPGRADFTSAGLDAGVEASGPHDFAVRTSLVRTLLIAHGPFANPPCNPVARKTLPRPPHSTPRFLTIMIRPSCGVGCEKF
jgi:hypothetical protein